MKTQISQNTIGLIVVVGIIVAAIYGLNRLKPSDVPTTNSDATVQNIVKSSGSYEPAKEIVDPSGFINTDGIKISDLVGKKVILVDFWTYSCINCQRTLPYLTDWYKKYADQGLEIVAVHTPEFEFEKKYANVVDAVKKFGITYPVVLDNDYATWRAYGNRYWPRKYLIDIDGNIVYDHIGEGKYEETEQKIQELLQQRRERLGETEAFPSQVLTQETVGDVAAGSPETYFGSARNETLANGRPGIQGSQTLQIPTNPRANELYLGGTWNIQDEYAENTTPGDTVMYRYKAKKVYMVARSDNPVQVNVLQDGKQVQELTILKDQLYTLIDDTDMGEHTLELQIQNSRLQLFTFTFG